MRYYDPSAWITDPSDKVIDDCEARLKLDKSAHMTKGAPGPCFGPFISLEWDVIIKVTGELLLLKQWVDRVGKIEIDLLGGDKYLRKGHYNGKKPHNNPDKQIIPAPHHVHFPTVKHPSLNVQSVKYAYPSKVNGNYKETIQRFSQDTNIVLTGSLPLWRKVK